VPNTYILASYFNATMNDVFTGLSSVMTRDGQSPMTANLPMGGNKITGLGTGVNPADAVTFAQVFTGGTFTSPVLVTPTASDAILTGVPVAPTAAPGTNSTQVANTKFVADSFAPLASPALTGAPTAPTQLTSDNSSKLATTAYVTAKALAPPNLPGYVRHAGFNAFNAASGAFVGNP
jgi:hypothetical protein